MRADSGAGHSDPVQPATYSLRAPIFLAQRDWPDDRLDDDCFCPSSPGTSASSRAAALTAFLGDLSFPLYLVHWPCHNALLKPLWGGQPGLGGKSALTLLTASTAVTLALYALVDRPLERWRKRTGAWGLKRLQPVGVRPRPFASGINHRYPHPRARLETGPAKHWRASSTGHAPPAPQSHAPARSQKPQRNIPPRPMCQ